MTKTLIRRLVARVRNESGQALVLGTMAMTAMLGMSALTIDVGTYLAHERRLQNAVDAAALAGAWELPGNPAASITSAQTYLGLAQYDQTQTIQEQITPGFDGDPQHLEVDLTVSRPSVFGGIFGIGTVDIRVRAAAEAVTAFDDGYAIFAIGDSCGGPGVTVGGGSSSFDGIVHSNSNIDVGGSNHSFDPAVTYSCDFSDGGSNNTYTQGQWRTGARPVPGAVAPWDYSAFVSWGCTFTFSNPTNLKSVNAVWIDPQKTQLLPGLYCFEKSVTLIGDDITGNVTFAAMGNINLSGSDWVLTAFHPSDILMYSESSTGPTQIDISMTDGSLTGIFYSPNGDISYQGQGTGVVNGSLVGQNVAVGGNGLSINAGALNGNQNPVVRLID